MPTDLERLYSLHGPALRLALRRRFGDGPPDPDDVLQDAFLKYLRLANRDEVDRPAAFLFAMARNMMIDEIRRLGIRQKHREALKIDPSYLNVEEKTPEYVLESGQRFAALNAALETLPPRQKEFIVMSRIEGLSYREIASRTGSSEATISREIAKALGALRTELLKKGQ